MPWEEAGCKRFALLLFNLCRAMENQTSKVFQVFQWLVEIIVRTARGSQTQVSSSAFVMESVSIHVRHCFKQFEFGQYGLVVCKNI